MTLHDASSSVEKGLGLLRACQFEHESVHGAVSLEVAGVSPEKLGDLLSRFSRILKEQPAGKAASICESDDDFRSLLSSATVNPEISKLERVVPAIPGSQDIAPEDYSRFLSNRGYVGISKLELMLGLAAYHLAFGESLIPDSRAVFSVDKKFGVEFITFDSKRGVYADGWSPFEAVEPARYLFSGRLVAPGIIDRAQYARISPSGGEGAHFDGLTLARPDSQ